MFGRHTSMHERASSFCPAGARIRCRLERASRHGLASATLVVHTRPDRSRCRLWKFTPRPLHTRHRRYSEHRQEQRAVRASAGEGSLAPPSLSHKGSTARVHSVAGTMSASSHTSSRPRVSTFRAWHQPCAGHATTVVPSASLAYASSLSAAFQYQVFD